MVYSWILIGGVAVLLRWVFGKQPWYAGVGFFVVACPLAVMLLTGLYAELDYSAEYTTRVVGRDAITGSIAGALLLCYDWFGDASSEDS